MRSIREGTPFVEIIRYAKEEDIDLIVLATHGRMGLSCIVLGSVAERVVRKAPFPVLTALTFFGIGALKSRFAAGHWLRSGAETFLMGGGAACVAYGVGVLLAGLA